MVKGRETALISNQEDLEQFVWCEWGVGPTATTQKGGKLRNAKKRRQKLNSRKPSIATRRQKNKTKNISTIEYNTETYS